MPEATAAKKAAPKKPAAQKAAAVKADRKEILVGAAMMRSKEFRAQLVQNPRAVAKTLGVTLSNAEVTYLQNLDLKKFDAVAKRFQDWSGLHPAGGPTWS